MMTVSDISKITGVSVRTLHYYDEIGLLIPPETTDAGYRLYDDTSLARLQQILLFRELEFPLKDIKKILDSPGFDKRKALSEQIELLTLKKEHFESLISYAEKLKGKGDDDMSFDAFDNKKIESYKAEAKKRWGDTDAYRQYAARALEYTDDQQQRLASEMMQIFKELGKNKHKSPADDTVQGLVKKLQDFITANYYICTKQILSRLGQMYSAGGEMSNNINTAAGAGTAEFAAKAIEVYCK